MEKSQKTRKKCSELENSDKITLSSYQNSKDIGEKKKQFSQPIIFDNENLERLNTNKYIDLKMIRKNFFSRENSKPVFQRASTSHQLFRFLPQKNDFAYKFNEEKTLKNRNYMIRPPTTSSNFYPGFNNFISDSNFVNSNREKISPKYNDSHLKYK